LAAKFDVPARVSPLFQQADKMALARVHYLPETVLRDSLAGGTAVVIDLLRATTTLCHALAAGAAEVRICMEVEETRQLAAQLGRDRCLLGGERGGVKIDGFDFGNSPSEYLPERVAGKTLIFTTTNGTRAISSCLGADRVLLASLVNLSAVSAAIAERSGTVDIVCAGTNGQLTREDILAAGAIVATLSSMQGGTWTWNDEALVARDAWHGVAATEQPRDSLLAALRDSIGGRNLVELGYDADIDSAAAVDSVPVVPVVTTDERGPRIVAGV
jgi:2-phosphosulfolactate phosphatase